jgi:ribosomal protein S18 acetylase RimI-like enzyme
LLVPFEIPFKSYPDENMTRETNNSIEIAALTKVDAEVIQAMARLVPQLSSSVPIPTAGQIQEIVGSPCTTLLVARDPTGGGEIVGSLTLAVFRIPTGVRAWIEDVVVDSSARGKGVGEALSLEALRIAAARGARTVELTSRPSRQAANRLYRRLGFQPRETNVYRYSSESGGAG